MTNDEFLIANQFPMTNQARMSRPAKSAIVNRQSSMHNG